jgi:hypothetical protein
MATALVQEFQILDGDRSTTNYDDVVGKIGLEADPPAGLVVHTAGWDEKAGVFRILTVWESSDDATAFMRDRLQPVLDQGPATPTRREEPDLETMYELHHIVRGK